MQKICYEKTFKKSHGFLNFQKWTLVSKFDIIIIFWLILMFKKIMYVKKLFSWAFIYIMFINSLITL